MNNMTTAQAAQQNNRDNGGKYATKEHAEVTLSDAQDAYFSANESSSMGAVNGIRAVVLDEFPNAAYIVLESSDQGDYAAPGAIFDADGNQLYETGDDDYFDEAVDEHSGWLSVDNPYAWESEIVNDELPFDKPAHSHVIKVTPPVEGPTTEESSAQRASLFNARDQLNDTSVKEIADDVRSEFPGAAYVVLEPSDQGDYCELDEVRDENGNVLLDSDNDDEDFRSDSDAADAARNLSHDNSWQWQKHQVEHGNAPFDVARDGIVIKLA